MKKSIRTKQRILSTALALTLMLSLLLVGASAANGAYSVEGMNSVPTITQSGSGGYALKSDGSLWAWSLDWAYADNIEGVAGRNIEGSPYTTNSNFIHVVDNYGLTAGGELWSWGHVVPGEPSASGAIKVADNIAMIDRQMTYPNDCIVLTMDGDLVKWAGNTNADGSRTRPVFSKNPEVLLANVISFATDAYNSRIWRALKADGTLWYCDANGVVTKEMDNVAAFSCDEQLVALTLVIKKDGTLWGWGDNTYGQVGNSRGYTRTAPGGIGDELKYYQDTPVKILDNVIYAAAGTASFAIASDGTLYGWGLNENNELGFTGGNRVYEASWLPWNFQDVPKVITTNAAAVASSSGTTIVLKRDGTLWSCGSNLYGAAGQSTKTYSRVETLTKMMDGVAFPEGMIASGTTTTPPVHPNTPPANAAFSDTAGHWANEYIKKAADNGLVNGVGNGKFEPDRTVSNAEWATMVVNLLYKNDTGRSGDYWWSANMDIAGSQRNIFAGTVVAANGTSNWDAAKVQSGINRYDMAQVICNIAKEQGWPIPDTSGTSSKIADWSSIPANYREAVAYCFSAEFVTGVDSKGTFSGAGTMTRAQAATVLCRLLDVVMEGGPTEITPVTPEDTTTPTIGEDDLSAFADEIRQEFYILLNNHRIANGLRELEENLELQEYADIRAAEQRITFGHTRPDGTAAGSGWHNSSNIMNTRFAENAISVYWVDLNTDAKTLANNLFTAWKESPGHNRHMLYNFGANITMALGLDLKIESGRLTTPGIWATGY